MKIFQTLQEYIFVLGIRPLEPDQKYSFSWRHLFGFVFLGRYAASAIPIAETFREYTDALYAVWTSALVLFNFVVILLKTGKFFKFIDNFEQTIEQRKSRLASHYLTFLVEPVTIRSNSISTGQTNPTSKRIYDETNEKIEKFTKTIYFVYIRLTIPGVVLPTAIISYFNYFTTDMGNDAFRLPFPDW